MKYSVTRMISLFNIISFVLAPIVSGVFLFLSFPKYDFHWLSWVALVPLLLVTKQKKPWQAFLMGWVCGLVFFIGASLWVRDFPVTNSASSLAYLYLGLYFGLFSLCWSSMLGRIGFPLLTAAPIWIVFEYCRSNFFFLGFPAVLLGHTQYTNIPFIQVTALTGVYGVSFLIVLANGVIADFIVYLIHKKKGDRINGLPKYNPLVGGVLTFLIISVVWVAGWEALPSESDGRQLSIAVVQGNIPQENKWKREYREQIISRYEELSEEASRSHPHCIVWPEASTPGFVLDDGVLLNRIVSMVRRTNSYFLIGSAEYPKFSKRPLKLKSGNTALFFSPEGKILGQYVKIRLVPFAEYVPHEEIIPWPNFIVPKKKANFHARGTEPILFVIDGARFGTLICWEILFSDLTRSLVKNGANFIANISNEAWFGKSAVSNQILAMCVFRAVENRVNVVRSANTGISCFIDPYGRITGKVSNGAEDIFVSGTLTREIHLSPPGTFYTRFGDVFAYGCVAFSMGLMVLGFFKRRHDQKGHSS